MSAPRIVQLAVGLAAGVDGGAGFVERELYALDEHGQAWQFDPLTPGGGWVRLPALPESPRRVGIDAEHQAWLDDQARHAR